jgi:hypothetical protein
MQHLATAASEVGGHKAVRQLHCTPIAAGVCGTEGLITGPAGEYYASEESGRGIIWRCNGRFAAEFCDLTKQFGRNAGMLLGLARIDGDLFVAAPKFQGGSIIKIPLKHPKCASVFVTHLGPIPNGLISDGRVLFVSETIFSHLYRLPLNRKPDTAPSTGERFPSPRPAPNGLALSPNNRILYVIHTGMISTGYVSAIDASTLKLRDVAPFTGMGDGIAWWRGALWGCRQKEGELVRIDPSDLKSQTVYRLSGGLEPGGIRPASIAFSNKSGATTGAVTDVARANAFNYLLRSLGFPLHWHHNIYQFSTRSL